MVAPPVCVGLIFIAIVVLSIATRAELITFTPPLASSRAIGTGWDASGTGPFSAGREGLLRPRLISDRLNWNCKNSGDNGEESILGSAGNWWRRVAGALQRSLSAGRSKRVLLLMSDTGGGHRASAQALEHALHREFRSGVEIKTVDLFTSHGRWPFNRVVALYRFLGKHPWTWKAAYMYGEFLPTKELTEWVSAQSNYKGFRRVIEDFNPDLVVSLHPLCQRIPISIVQEINKKRAAAQGHIAFVTIVTDLGSAHSTWFDRRVDACYVPSEAVRKLALRHGIAPSKVVPRGLLVRPSFWEPSIPKSEIRKSLGLSEQLKTVLLMGGGDGVGGLTAIAVELVQRLNSMKEPSQVVVICGHNDKLAKNLASSLRERERQRSKVSVSVKGFVDNVDEYMCASDCLITKAGPGTIAESMIRGLPLVISSFLPGQESGNVPYVVKGGFGVYTGNRPRKIADKVVSLFANEEALKQMSLRAKESSRPESAMTIAKDLHRIVLNSSGTAEQP